MRLYQTNGEVETMANYLNSYQVDAGDVVEFVQKDGMKFRGIVELKLQEYCKIRFCHFEDKNERDKIGKQISLYYGEKMTFNAISITSIYKVSNELELVDGHYHSLMDLALQIDDEEWFNELGKRRKSHATK
jgi:hypothetical protein